MDAAGGGVANATVKVDGVAVTTTDGAGAYHLEALARGTYAVAAEKAHMQFSGLSKVVVEPTLAILPDMVATNYALCGRVTLTEARFPVKRQVTLSAASDSSAPQRTQTGARIARIRLPPLTTQRQQESVHTRATGF
jgi:hypothetical protein